VHAPVNWRRRLLTCAAVVLFLVLAAGLAIRQAGAFLAAPAQTAVKSDLIVSLGGEMGERSEMAAELYRAGYGGRVLLTGFAGAPPDPRRQFLNWRIQYLLEQRVPAEALLIDATANNSWEEAANTLKLMREHGWRRVLVISEPPHLRRLSWTWSRVFEGSGMEYRLIASPMSHWNADAWWRDERSGVFVITEYLKIAYYMASRR
jgi:uncharacterized SAM-binding protein YcdF (DUF218 family)